VERLGDDLLRRVQPAVRVLPERGHLATAGRRGGRRRRPGCADARPAATSGCHNINLVTPEHVLPQALEALPIAIERGLHLPLVYNTSAYDGLDGIRLLDGVVDVYMPDVKLFDPDRSHRYLGVRDYPEVARAVVTEMHRQVGDLVVDEQGLALHGLLVRHLVMPGCLDDTRRVTGFLAALSTDIYLNVMAQYRPAWKVPGSERYAAIDRPTSTSEHREALAAARAAGLWRLDQRWR
jgi:putative pyruvate formate lyase activating enzyme